MDLKKLTIKEARAKLASKELSAKELFDAYKKEIDSHDRTLNAYISTFDFESNGDAGMLAGIPGAIKDNILIKGKKCTAGSNILKNYTAVYDATVTKKMKEAGVIFLGKTNQDEFAMGSTGENSAFGPAKNPHDHTRVPGGSSSGSAAAVAGGLALFALGSETNGSIRMPAGWTGIVGFKPTYGRVSRNGLIAFGSSLDQIGPLTKTVEDSALVMNAIAGHDEFDSTSAEVAVPDYTEFLNKDIKGLKVAVPKEFFGSGLNEDVRLVIEKAIGQLEDLGAHIEYVSIPSFDYGLAMYYVLAPSEASANLARFDGIRYGHSTTHDAEDLMEVYTRSRAEGFGPEVRRRIMIGTYALSAGYYDAYYKKAQQVRTILNREMDEVLSKYDVVVGPTNASVAPKIGELKDPLSVYLADIYMTTACLAGLPSISVPAGTIDVDGKALPVGMHITAKQFDEGTVFKVAHTFEQSQQ